MIARSVNAAADVIHRAQVNGTQTATGLAIALESAQLLMSPEMVHEMADVEAERDRLKARVVELEQLLADAPIAVTLTEKASVAADKLTRLLAPTQTLRVEEDCDHPNGYGPNGCAGCGAFAPADDEDGVSSRVARLRNLLAGQRTAVEGEHYTSVHHTYQLGRDLPETGGA
ncbi:MAG: hypothetical protein HOV92_18090 [Streptomyces sp.]|nr:hypothetical protein [Streptomyces sp.]